MRVTPQLIGAALMAIATAHAGVDDPGILSFPIGVVVGEHTIEVNLGATDEPAELFLDGEKICDCGGKVNACTVDFGAEPAIHLVELLRRNENGTVVARAYRWFNRPGQEAELDFLFKPRTERNGCGGQVVWLHPLKQDPAFLDVEHNGRRLRISEDGRSFAFPCPDAATPNLLAASSVFPDGRRAEKVAALGSFGDREGVAMTAAPLVTTNRQRASCDTVKEHLVTLPASVESSGFEVVFVLDPSAGYRGLLSSSRSRFSGGNAWRRADASLFDAERIWFVRPDDKLSRINGFAGNTRMGFESSSGKNDWLGNLFAAATLPFDDETRLADAVVASGLVAAAGPRRRAIVLVLGDRAERDASQFTPAQARNYLSEIGVPLHVLRIGKIRDDGWPLGTRTLTLPDFAKALESAKAELDRQCTVWFRGDLRLDDVARSLPPGLVVAGREGHRP
jgi:hypothetical protein